MATRLPNAPLANYFREVCVDVCVGILFFLCPSSFPEIKEFWKTNTPTKNIIMSHTFEAASTLITQFATVRNVFIHLHRAEPSRASVNIHKVLCWRGKEWNKSTSEYFFFFQVFILHFSISISDNDLVLLPKCVLTKNQPTLHTFVLKTFTDTKSLKKDKT